MYAIGGLHSQVNTISTVADVKAALKNILTLLEEMQAVTANPSKMQVNLTPNPNKGGEGKIWKGQQGDKS
jgi:hypothetical protein